MKQNRSKFIASLTFRGFSALPETVQSLMGRHASLLVTRGESRKPSTTPFQRSAASWSIEFPDSARLDQMIVTLIESLGGLGNLINVRNAVSPEFFEIDVSMWIKDSKEQEGGLIEPSTIKMLSLLGTSLSFGFYSRHDN
jgi:hypothetical protein